MNKSKDRSPLNNAGQKMMGGAARESPSDTKKSTLELQQRIEDLTNEVKQKDITISALQRNVELISRVYKQETEKSLEWADKLSKMENEISAQKAKTTSVENQKAKLLSDLEKVQEELKRSYRNVEEYRIVRQENLQNKALLEKKKKEVEELQRKLEICKGEADALKLFKVDLGASLKKVQAECEALANEKPLLLKEIERLRSENSNYVEVIKKKEKEHEESCEQLILVRAREQKYFAELSVVKQNFSVEKNELIATRAKLIELYEHYQLLEQKLETKEALSRFNS